MKNKILSFILVLILLSFIQAQGQSIVGGNIIKLNLSSVAIQSYNIQYERVLSPKHSYAIGIGISPDVQLPFAGTLKDDFSDNADATATIESMRFKKFTFTPEYRFYINKKGAPAGFYVATYIRYTNMSSEGDYYFTPDNSDEHIMHLKGDFMGVGGGAMIGIQYLLGTNFTIDWWIVGPFIGGMDSSFDGVLTKGAPLTPEQQADLESDIEAVDIPLWELDATIGSTTGDVQLNGPFVGCRFMGLCFGFRF